MNFIVIIYDTLRYDYVGVNGIGSIHTPYWDRFAEKAWNFSRCYSGSYPSLPHRCDCATGRFVYPFYGWQPMPEEEVNLCQKLTDAGYISQSISDGNMWADNGPGDGFEGNLVVKPGVEVSDSEIAETELPCAAHKSRIPDSLRKHWALRSRLIQKGEEKNWPQAQVMLAAEEWVKKQSGSDAPFFLWIESWRIHEPWIDPPEYVDMYDPGYKGEKVALPSYSPNVDYLTPAELNHVRAMYAASVTFSDKWFGHFLDSLEELGRLEDTMIILSADHGWSLGDHNRTGKHGVPFPRQKPWPLYEECAHVPLLVHVPEQSAAGRSGHLVQHADILPTLLDFAGIEAGPTVKGVSWKPVLEGKKAVTRDLAVTTTGMNVYNNPGNTRITLTSDDWSFILPTPLNEPELYNLAIDPGQTMDVYRSHIDVAQEMFVGFMELVKKLGIDEEKADSWKDVLADPRVK
jgi:arylsulfatase A-like enzyme